MFRVLLLFILYFNEHLGPVIQSIISLTSSLRVISLTVSADSIHNILIFFAEKMWVAFACKSYSHFFSKKFQHICVWLDVNFNELLTNDIVNNTRPWSACLQIALCRLTQQTIPPPTPSPQNAQILTFIKIIFRQWFWIWTMKFVTGLLMCRLDLDSMLFMTCAIFLHL